MRRIYITTGRGGGKTWFQERLNKLIGYSGQYTIFDEDHDDSVYEKEKEKKMIINNAKAILDGKTFKVQNISIRHEAGTYPTAELEVSLNPLNQIPSGVIIHDVGGTLRSELLPKPKPIIPSIKNVIFSYPATIVFWTDGTKTIVKCKKGDQWDPHAGISAAISKKFFGTQVNKWVKKAEYAKVPPVDGGDE